MVKENKKPNSLAHIIFRQYPSFSGQEEIHAAAKFRWIS